MLHLIKLVLRIKFKPKIRRLNVALKMGIGIINLSKMALDIADKLH